MTQTVATRASPPARALRVYRTQPRIASVLQLVALLAATALLGGIVIASLLVGILDLLTTSSR